MAVSSLGQYEFDCWKATESPYTLPKEHLETETRSGLDGFTTWLVGMYGDPFEVDTVKMVDTYLNSIDVKRQYELLKGDVGLELTWDGALVDGYVFKVLEVKPKCTKIVHGRVAGVDVMYLARVDTKWTLAAIPYSEQ